MAILLANPFSFITKFMGWIMNYIYVGVDSILNTNQVAWSIIGFTVIIYTLLLPLTIKQQKFSRISAIMNPEIQAIQKKYKGKTDQASMLKQQDEMKLVYQKYGTSPTGGCLTSLIQLPILFALWPVIRSIEKYVSIKPADTEVAYKFLFFDKIDVITPSVYFSADKMKEYGVGTAAENPLPFIVCILIAISIPILAGLSQWLSMKTAQSKAAQNNKAQEENQMMSQMNTTMKIMPIFSVIMCFSMPIGLGLYWVVSAVVRLVQQVVINAVLDKKPVEEMVKENMEKLEKKNSKKKAVDSKNVNSMATKYTKRIEEMKKQVYEDAAKQEEREQKAKVQPKPMQTKPKSLSAKANMVNDYNKRNNK